MQGCVAAGWGEEHTPGAVMIGSENREILTGSVYGKPAWFLSNFRFSYIYFLSFFFSPKMTEASYFPFRLTACYQEFVYIIKYPRDVIYTHVKA